MPVGAGAERRIRQRLAEIAPLPQCFGSTGKLAEDQRQFAVLVVLEAEHARGAGLPHRLRHVGIVRPRSWAGPWCAASRRSRSRPRPSPACRHGISPPGRSSKATQPGPPAARCARRDGRIRSPARRRLCRSSVSQTWPMPTAGGAAQDEGVEAVELPSPLSTGSPPFGARGFTQGQYGKSAGRAGSPSRARAWVRVMPSGPGVPAGVAARARPPGGAREGRGQGSGRWPAGRGVASPQDGGSDRRRQPSPRSPWADQHIASATSTRAAIGRRRGIALDRRAGDVRGQQQVGHAGQHRSRPAAARPRRHPARRRRAGLAQRRGQRRLVHHPAAGGVPPAPHRLHQGQLRRRDQATRPRPQRHVQGHRIGPGHSSSSPTISVLVSDHSAWVAEISGSCPMMRMRKGSASLATRRPIAPKPMSRASCPPSPAADQPVARPGAGGDWAVAPKAPRSSVPIASTTYSATNRHWRRKPGSRRFPGRGRPPGRCCRARRRAGPSTFRPGRRRAARHPPGSGCGRSARGRRRARPAARVGPRTTVGRRASAGGAQALDRGLLHESAMTIWPMPWLFLVPARRIGWRRQCCPGVHIGRRMGRGTGLRAGVAPDRVETG